MLIATPHPAPDHHQALRSLAHTSNSDSRPAVDQGIHAFKRPAHGDFRSVCPALNTLANHGYLPRDGKNISFSTLSHALQAGYGISPVFADFLVFGGYMLLRRSVLKPLDLHIIGKHDCIEHNASVVHDDDVDGSKTAPTHVDPALLHKFISKAYSPPSLQSSEGCKISLEDMAHTRVAREAAVKCPPDALHAEIARGEFAMVLDIFGSGPAKTMSAEDLEVWLKDNRFPAGWAPTHQETLLDTVAESKKMRALMLAYRGEEPHGLLSSVEKMLTHQGEELHGFFAAIGKTMESLVDKFEKMAHSPAAGPKSDMDEKTEALKLSS